ncbi:MAG: TonB-dependent receptor [Asticcacaulis sp.]
MSIHKSGLKAARHLAGASVLALLIGAGFSASAQADEVAESAGAAADATADAAIEEVTITARRRSERLQNVPLAISAVRGSELSTQQLDRVTDYQFKVPNFNAVQQNTRVSTLLIRGLGGNANNDGAESGVGLIVDNVFYTHVGFSWIDFIDTDGIEVARGPQGTLLGKNTTIGALIVKTKLPSFEPELKLEATYASYDRKKVRASWTGPIIDDKLAFRLTGSLDNGGGWVTNQYDGTKYLDNGRFSLRGQLLFTPSENISNRFIIEHNETREYNNFYPPAGDATHNLNLNGTVHSVRAGGWENRLKSVFGYTPSYDIPNNANLNTQQRLFSKVDGVSNELNWDIGGLTFTSISAWRKLNFRPKNDGDYSPYSILHLGYDVDAEQLSQEFRLANQTGGTFDWQVGAYYLRQEVVSDLHFRLYKDASAFFLSGNPLIQPQFVLPVILDGVDYSKRGETNVDSKAVFAQGTWHFTDRFDVTAGLRYTKETREVSVVGSSTGGSPLVGPLAALAPVRGLVLGSLAGTSSAGGLASAGIFDISDEKDGESVSWLFNPSYKLSDTVLIYGVASYGEKSGAANTTASPLTPTFTQPLIIKPEKSTDYEIGFKSTFADNRAVVNVNLYRNTIEDFQSTQLSQSGVALVSYLGNVGEARLQGIEIETRFRVTPNFNLTLNGAYNDAKYVSYEDAPAPVEYAVALGGQPLSLSGEQIVGVPKVNVQLSVDYETPVASNLNLFAYGNTLYRSEVELVNPHSQYGHQDAYSLTNIGIGLRTPDQRFSVLLWSRNLFDKRYAVGYGSASAVNPFIAIQGDPRTVGLTLTGRF